MRGNRELNIISVGWAPGLLAIFVSISMQLSLSPVQITSAQITPTDSSSATDTTVFSFDTGIPLDNQLTSSILGETPNNATLTNSSSIIQSALLPAQLPLTPVSPDSSLDDDDDNNGGNNGDNDDDDEDRTSPNDNNGENDDNDGNGDDNDDDRTRSSSDDDDSNDDSNRQSISIQRSEGGVSVSVG